jgi:hypothetical protein
MHNWHAIESEADYRRLEWQRAVAADARAAVAQMACKERRRSWSSLKLKQLVVPAVSLLTSFTSRRNTSTSYATGQPCRAS